MTEAKSLVDDMTASETAARRNCVTRSASPLGVPGIPGRSFISTPGGCCCAGFAGAGAATSMGCTTGRLANILPAPPHCRASYGTASLATPGRAPRRAGEMPVGLGAPELRVGTVPAAGWEWNVASPAPSALL